MELKHLRYFLAVADLKSFSRAASQLNISQPVLSRQIKKLEEELQTALFYRDGRGAHLTDAGSELYSHAIRITDRVSMAVKAVHRHQHTELSEISVGAPPSLGPHFLADITGILRANYPRTRLCIIEGYSEQLADWLLTGRLDVALLYDARVQGAIEVRQRISERLGLITHPGHPLTVTGEVDLKELQSLTLLAPGHPSTTRDCLERVADQHGYKLTYDLQVESIPALKALVSAGVGAAVLPIAAVQDELNWGTLAFAEIVNPSAPLDLALCLSPQGRLSRSIYPVCELIRAYMKTQVRMQKWRATLS